MDSPRTRTASWIARSLLLGALTACGDEAPSKPRPACEAKPRGDVTVVSPSEGVTLRVPEVAVVARLGPKRFGAEATVCLDGAPLPRAMPIVRERRSTTGGGYDVLATMELSDLEPGPHELAVVVDTQEGERLVGVSRFTWDRPPHKLTLRVVDEAGRPAAARVVVTDGERFVDLGSPDRLAADPTGRDHALHSVFVLDGAEELWLDPGHYRLLALRGLREDLGVAELTLDGDAEVRLTAPRVVESEALAADLHVHTGRSYDSFVPDRLRLESLIAAGVEVSVITDHGRVSDPDRSLLELAGENRGGIRGVPGVEHDIEEPGPDAGGHFDQGHLNAFPVRPGKDLDFPVEDTPTLAWMLDAWRERQGEWPLPGSGDALLLQLNHPRGIHFRPEQPAVAVAWPYFDELVFDPAVPIGEGVNAWMTEPEPYTGTIALDFDALEVVNRFSLELFHLVRADWFAMLNQGYVVTGTGNADSHALMVEVAGFPVNLVDAPRPGPGEPLDVAAFVEAVQAGRVVVSTGPVPSLVVRDGARAASHGETLRLEGEAVAELRVQAAPWVPVHEVRLVVNGEVVETLPLDPEAGGALDLRSSRALTLERDSWVLVEAGWPLHLDGPPQPILGGDYGLVAPGYVPLSFTNPVFIDVDGDGAWTPPGL